LKNNNKCIKSDHSAEALTGLSLMDWSPAPWPVPATFPAIVAYGLIPPAPP